MNPPAYLPPAAIDAIYKLESGKKTVYSLSWVFKANMPKTGSSEVAKRNNAQSTAVCQTYKPYRTTSG